MPTFVHKITTAQRTKQGFLLQPGFRFSEESKRKGIKKLYNGYPLEVRTAEGESIQVRLVSIKTEPQENPNDPTVIPIIETEATHIPENCELWILDGSKLDIPDAPETKAQKITNAFTRYSALSSNSDHSKEDLVKLVEDVILLHQAGRIKNLESLGRLKNKALKAIPDHPVTEGIVSYLKLHR